MYCRNVKQTNIVILFFIALTFVFESSGCVLMANITSNSTLNAAYERASTYSSLAFHSYFFYPFLDKKLTQHKGKRYFLLSDGDKSLERRNGLAIGISLGQLNVGEIDLTNLSTTFRESLKKQTYFFKNSYWIPQIEAEKIAVVISDEISWKDGIKLLKDVYGTSEDAIQIKSFEDALFTVFLRIERPPEDISIISRIFGSSEEKERQKKELENDRSLFIAYMNAAIRCCEERMGCSDSDLEKIYSECVAEKKKGRKLD